MSEHDAQVAEGAEERLEQIFQRVEEESKRRALAAEEAEARTTSRLSQVIPEETPSISGSGSATPSPATSARPVVGERRRGSVSVSRFGQAPGATTTGDTPRAETPAAAAAYTVNPGAFYAVQNHEHGSADSLASSADAHAPAPEDEASVVQMATISGRQSLSRAFGRRLSRAKTPSRAGLNGMLIGVSVEEATVEHHSDDEPDADGPFAHAVDAGSPDSAKADADGDGQKKVGRARAASRSIVYAGTGPPPGTPLASRPGTSSEPPLADAAKGTEAKVKAKGSRASMPDEADAGAAGKSERRWLVRAKDFTKRLKRKSMVALGAAR